MRILFSFRKSNLKNKKYINKKLSLNLHQRKKRETQDNFSKKKTWKGGGIKVKKLVTMTSFV